MSPPCWEGLCNGSRPRSRLIEGGCSITPDGLLAVFGADEAREDDQKIRAGLALIEISRTRDPVDRLDVNGLDVRVGINTGPTMIGGTVEGRDALHGHAVNVAARMEQSAPIGGLRLSHNTYRLAHTSVGRCVVTRSVAGRGVRTPSFRWRRSRSRGCLQLMW
jgi:class 3 adenylate cyclase